MNIKNLLAILASASLLLVGCGANEDSTAVKPLDNSVETKTAADMTPPAGGQTRAKQEDDTTKGP